MTATEVVKMSVTVQEYTHPDDRVSAFHWVDIHSQVSLQFPKQSFCDSFPYEVDTLLNDNVDNC